jgi:flavin-dependent dehydrogenase
MRRAVQLGVSLIWGAKHVRIAPNGVHLAGQFVASDLIVGADGLNSPLRRQAGLDRIISEKRRYGFRRHYRIAPWSEYVEIHWGKNCQIYVTPIANDEVSVAVLSRDPNLRLENALRDNPNLSSILNGTRPTSVLRGSLTVSRVLKSVSEKNVVLMGDASGSVDAITGEGICVSLKQAQALAQVVDAGDLREYQAQHNLLMRRPRTMSSLLLLLDRSTHFRERVLRSLSECPAIFETLLSIHVGAADFSDLFSWGLLDLGRAFLAIL